MLDSDELATVRTTTLDRATVVHVRGEVDMSTGDLVARSVFAGLDERPPLLVIDLTGVSFMGSAGLNVLIEVHRWTRENATALRIVADTPRVLRPLEICGLLPVLPVVRSMDTALSA